MATEPETKVNTSAYLTACLAVSLLPLLFLVWKIYHFGFFFPYWDAWNFVPFVAKNMETHVTLADYWVLHNEHRPMLPRMAMLAFAAVSGWNVGWELALNVVLAVGVVGLLGLMALRLGKDEPFSGYAMLPLFSIIIFSWSQMESWIWGWALMIFLNVFFVCAGVLTLAYGKGSVKSLLFGIMFGYLALFSFANGILYWFAAAPMVLFVEKVRVRDRLPHFAVWVVSAALSMAMYFYQYVKPDVSPSLTDAFAAPLHFMGYLVLYLSAPITGMWFAPSWHGEGAPVGVLHFVPGVVGIALMAWLLLVFVRERKVPWDMLAPWLALAAYAVGSDLIIALGRVGFGLEHGITSRYVTIANLYWVALAGLGLCYARCHWDAQKPRRIHWGVAVGLLAVVAVLNCAGTARANTELEQVATWKRMSWKAIQMGYDHPMFLHDVSGLEAEMRADFLPFLREYGLCGLQLPPVKEPEQAAAYLAEARHFMEIDMPLQAQLYLGVVLYLDGEHKEARELMATVKQTMQERMEKHKGN